MAAYLLDSSPVVLCDVKVLWKLHKVVCLPRTWYFPSIRQGLARPILGTVRKNVSIFNPEWTAQTGAAFENRQLKQKLCCPQQKEYKI